MSFGNPRLARASMQTKLCSSAEKSRAFSRISKSETKKRWGYWILYQATYLVWSGCAVRNVVHPGAYYLRISLDFSLIVQVCFVDEIHAKPHRNDSYGQPKNFLPVIYQMVCSRFDLDWVIRCELNLCNVSNGARTVHWMSSNAETLPQLNCIIITTFRSFFSSNIYIIHRVPLSHSSLRERSARRSSKTALFHNGSEWELITLSDTTPRDDTGEEPSSDCKIELILAQVLG